MKVIGLIGGMSWNSTSERVMRGNTCLECDTEAIAVTIFSLHITRCIATIIFRRNLISRQAKVEGLNRLYSRLRGKVHAKVLPFVPLGQRRGSIFFIHRTGRKG